MSTYTAGEFGKLLLRWLLGTSLVSWRYLWETTPLYRDEAAGSEPADLPPEIPDDLHDERLLTPDEGVGPLFRRRFRVRVADPEASPEELMETVLRDFARFVPSEVVGLHRQAGEDGRLGVGDELVVEMPGPWNGPVRIVEIDERSLRLATLQGHMEAGQVQFRASGDADTLTFEVEAWARPSSPAVHLLYSRLRLAKEVQLNMWVRFCIAAGKIAGGRLLHGVEIHTRAVDVSAVTQARPRGGPASSSAARMLDELAHRRVNYDPEEVREPEWYFDTYRTRLPAEQPGEPEPGGSWETARRLVETYEFAVPHIVRATYRQGSELPGRDLLLEARFHGLHFSMGVRVTDVVDETRPDGTRVWGWAYETLQGHLERGRMSYEVVKHLDTGEVEFVVAGRSQRAPRLGPILRLGWRMFGRRTQLRFYDECGRRLERLVAAVTAGTVDMPSPQVIDGLVRAPSDSRPHRLDLLAVRRPHPG